MMRDYVKFEARVKDKNIRIPQFVVEQIDLKEGDVVGVTLEKIFVDEETLKGIKKSL